MKNKIFAITLALLMVLGTVPMIFGAEQKGPGALSASASPTDKPMDPMILRSEAGREKYKECKEKLLEEKPELTVRELEIACAPQLRAIANQVKAQVAQNTIGNCVERMMDADGELTEEKAQEACKLKLKPTTPMKVLLSSQKLKQYKKEFNYKARNVMPARIEQARKNYLGAKQNFETAKENMKLALDNFAQARKAAKSCDDAESDDCKQSKDNIMANGKRFFNHKADLYISHLEKIKNKVESNEYMDGSKSDEIIADLDSKIAEIQEMKAAIENATTKQELVKATKELQNRWKRLEHRASSIAGLHVNSRMGGVLLKTEQLQARLDLIVEKMQERGDDTAEIEALVEIFKEEKQKALDAFEEAQDLFEQARGAGEDVSEEEVGKLVKEAQAKMTEAKGAIKNAQDTLKDIVKEIRDNGAEEVIEETSEVEVEVSE